MDEFEDEYADELEAMAYMSDDERMSPKPRKCLNFNTPKNKTSQKNLDNFDSPFQSLTDSWTGSGQKRGRDEIDTQSESDLEYDDEDLNVKVPVSKKSRVEQDDNEDLWDDDDLDLSKPFVARPLHDVKISKTTDTYEMEAPPSPDRLIMEKILEHRNKSGRELKLDPQVSRNERLIEDYDFERPRVFKRIPNTSYLPTTGTEGNRVYMEVRDDSYDDKQFENMSKTLKGSNLLSVPISVLRQQLEEERRNDLLAASERLGDQVTSHVEETDQGFIDDDNDNDDDKENQAPNTSIQLGPQKLLWVEKYTPQTYTDLLSEESINRTLLHWLKMWDYVVFDKELPLRLKDKKKDKKKEENKKYKKWNQPEVSEELDDHNRPQQKIALLCGPPGLGKTTLAHIIARHAGYSVVEMNASDDRSAEVFKNKIESATQMKAVLGSDPRPNCLVIDEIDGAPQAAINVLLNVIRKSDSPEESKKKKKKDEGGILRRPIICICNDQYVPALRQLRQCAMILNFPQTESTKLAGRLYEVVRIEKLKSDMNTLLALCEKTDNDIRSCLNTLQFIKGQCKELNMRNVQSMSVGQKDSHKSLFSVWNEVLTLPRPKRQKFVNLQDKSMKDIVLNTSPTARFSNILSVVQSAGEYEKLTQGLFENYLDCKFKDPYMDGVSMATDWLCCNDIMTQYIQHYQDYRILPYIPYIAVTFHFLFASNIIPKIQYPHSMADSIQKRIKCENLVASMMVDMLPVIRKFINTEIVVSEILSPLMEIMQPTFRPVNTQLYSKKEKEDLKQLVYTMISYNMTYQQQKTLDGQYNYLLEPHMDEVVKFPGMKQHRQLSYASKQLVAREIELEKMRRVEQAKAPKYVEPATEENSKKPVECKTPVVPSHLQKLTAKPLGKTEDVPVKDFFGRVIKRTTPETKTNKTTGKDEDVKTNILATDIWFHFQGGYSNAVRRNVKVKEFF
ncbi:hypothetical protein ACF0H5_001814 [Mactra antiquata]